LPTFRGRSRTTTHGWLIRAHTRCTLPTGLCYGAACHPRRPLHPVPVPAVRYAQLHPMHSTTLGPRPHLPQCRSHHCQVRRLRLYAAQLYVRPTTLRFPFAVYRPAFHPRSVWTTPPFCWIPSPHFHRGWFRTFLYTTPYVLTLRWFHPGCCSSCLPAYVCGFAAAARCPVAAAGYARITDALVAGLPLPVRSHCPRTCYIAVLHTHRLPRLTNLRQGLPSRLFYLPTPDHAYCIAVPSYAFPVRPTFPLTVYRLGSSGWLRIAAALH